ncbi:MAG: M14 family metallopeptidase [Acidobacteriota bacterium]
MIKLFYKVCIVLLLMFLIEIIASAQTNSDFIVGRLTARAGEKVSGNLEVPAGTDEATIIPITIVNGIRPGPVLALVAGVHGYEYAPIITLQKVLPQLNANELAGTIILVHVANIPSFLKRTIYYSPVDGKNLNRVFPGKLDGTLTERIAYQLTKEVIERSDYFVDIHCGDGNESLSPYMAYYADTPDASVLARAKALALAFGISCIKPLRGRPRDPNAAVYSTNAAMLRGKVSIAVESGELGRTDHESVSRIERGIFNLLRYLNMIAGQPENFKNHVIIDQEESVRSTVKGIFYPLVERGQPVRKGMLIGYVTDFFGRRIMDATAPLTGVVLYMLATPPISEGEPIASIGHIAETDVEEK